MRLIGSIVLVFLAVNFVEAQKNIQYRSSLAYPRIVSNIWGYTDTANGREYALVGVEHGLSIVDVTDAENPDEIFFVPTDTSIWQEPKVWTHYAYMTNENKGGILIVDLGNLPYSAPFTRWSNITGEDYQKSHSCFIDENGILYLNGSNLFNRGCLMCDLIPDPMNPVYIGKYDDFYVHDCFARNDTLYSSEILNGQFSVVDVRDKTNPQVIARQETPFFFSHNVWLSDDNQYLFNTDEKPLAPVTAYNIADLSNIKEVDRYWHNQHDSSIAHNTYYKEGFLYTSYYRDGVTIVDAHRPYNLIEVGHYDTSPFPSGNGFEGCWGVYCFLPSGNIICSDRQEGLFVLTPTLKRACYLEGKISDGSSFQPLFNVNVEIIGQPNATQTNLLGDYKTGVADSGKYDVRFTDFNGNCNTQIVTGVVLRPGMVTPLDFYMSCSFSTDLSEVDENFHLTALPSVFEESTIIQFQSKIEGATDITVHDSNGRQLKYFEINTPTASIHLGSELTQGMYIVTAKQQNHSAILKLVKN